MTWSALDLERIALSSPRPSRAERRQAARSRTGQTLRALGHAVGGGPTVTGLAGNVPAWIRLGACDALASHLNGTARVCAHRPTGDEPVLAAAWAPGLIVCLRCAGQLVFADDDPANRRCDRCGRLCEGGQGDPIYPVIAAVSVVIFQLGTCGGCRPACLGGTP